MIYLFVLILFIFEIWAVTDPSPLKESRPRDSDKLNLHVPQGASGITLIETLPMNALLLMTLSDSSAVVLEH